MDKSRRKELRTQYNAQARQAYLLNLEKSESSFIRGFAQIELGKDLPPLTKTIIDSATNGSELATKLCLKILEKAYNKDPKNKRRFTKAIEKAIDGFSSYLQAFYHTWSFEAAIAMGDIDKEFNYDGEFEKGLLDEKLAKLIAAYQLMENEKMLTLIQSASSANDYDSLQGIAAMYRLEEMDKHRLEFIKRHWKEFEFE